MAKLNVPQFFKAPSFTFECFYFRAEQSLNTHLAFRPEAVVAYIAFCMCEHADFVHYLSTGSCSPTEHVANRRFQDVLLPTDERGTSN